MQLLLFVIVSYIAASVHAGGIRAALEIIVFRRFQLVEIAAGISPADRKFLRFCDSYNFPQVIQYITGKNKLPVLPTSGDDFDHMAMARYLQAKRFAGNFQAEVINDKKTFDRIVKGADDYKTIFKLVGDYARELRANNILEEIDHLLDKAESATRDAWHSRRYDSQRFVLKSLKKEVPNINVKTTTEAYSDRSTYERWDKAATLNANPSLMEKIAAWEAAYPNDDVVRSHQTAIDSQQSALEKMGSKCSSDKLPQKRSLVVVNATAELENQQWASDLLARVSV